MTEGLRAVFYSRHDSGHRASYAETLTRETGMRRVGLRAAFLSPDPVLFLMIEERPLAYVLACLLRAVVGRRTVGLLFQPGATLRRDTARRRIKHGLLRVLRRIPACQTLAIEPFQPGDGFEAICDGWVHDFQLWDLSAEEAARVAAIREADAEPLAAEVMLRAAGRRVVSAIGRQDRAKGFDVFARLFADADTRQDYLFAFGGRVDPALAPDCAAFEEAGGVAADRRISDDELLGLYAAADLVWCCYAPGYDQASGVFGRAVQLGIPVVVRNGARLHRFCEAEGVPHLAYDGGRFADPAALPAKIDPPAGRTRAWREEALARLGEALRPPGRPS
jgi:hypothetical protein